MSPVAKKPAALVPSAASAWGTEPPEKPHQLPSGNVMVLRRGPSMRRLVMQGVIPSSIVGVELVPTEGGDRVMSINAKLFEEQRAAVVCAMAVDPGVVMEPLEGALLYDLLDEVDIQYVMAWAAEGLTGIAAFLELGSGDADGADSEAVGDTPE